MQGTAHTLHLLNLGAARTASLQGLPDGDWQVVETTEAVQFQQKGPARTAGGALRVELPARSLVTLTRP